PGQPPPLNPKIIIIEIVIFPIEGGIPLHHQTFGITLQPLPQGILPTAEFGQGGPFQWACNRFPTDLSPPTASALVLEHGIEMIHAHQSECLSGTLDRRFKDATRTANRTIGHHYGLSPKGVPYLVVVSDELYRIGPGL